MLLTLFRIVINWARQQLLKILKGVLRDYENHLCDKIARRVISSLLHRGRYHSKAYYPKKK